MNNWRPGKITKTQLPEGGGWQEQTEGVGFSSIHSEYISRKLVLDGIAPKI